MVPSTDEQLVAVAREVEDIARQRMVQEYQKKHERRSVQRVPFHQVMRLADARETEADTDSSCRAMLSLDVSRAGVGLVSPTHTLQVGTSVVVNCLPGHTEMMPIPGRVVRVDEVVPGLYLTGIEFLFRSDLLEAMLMK
jgi:hypothetical protein